MGRYGVSTHIGLKRCGKLDPLYLDQCQYCINLHKLFALKRDGSCLMNGFSSSQHKDKAKADDRRDGETEER